MLATCCLNSPVYFRFGIPFGIKSPPKLFQYIILSNFGGALHSEVGILLILLQLLTLFFMNTRQTMLLFYSNALRQIAWFINVAATGYSGIVGQKL